MGISRLIICSNILILRTLLIKNNKKVDIKRKMNICFFMGKIINDIDFEFIIDDEKYHAISIFRIELNNKSVVTVKGYNEIADFCYKNLTKNDYIAIYGNLNSKMEIILLSVGLI